MNDASQMDGATFNGRSEDARGCFTIVQSLQPARVGKRYSVDANGKLVKERPVASIYRGRATTFAATTENLVAALRLTTESSDTVLVLDSFRGAAPGSPAVIEVVTDEELGRLTDGADAASPNQGYFETEDAFWSARLKDRMEPSRYLLLDADNAAGMPEEWRKLTLAERLEMFDRPELLPGLSKCRRIEYLGSSARVVKKKDKSTPAATHALIEISNPELINTLRAHVRVATVLAGLSFKSPKYSRSEPGKIIAHSDLTLFDLVVWVGGRLVFNPRPDVSAAPGYRVLDANVQVVNPQGGPLDVSWIKPPDVKARKVFREKTGVKYKLDPTRSSGFVFEERGQLQFLTEVEVDGVVKPLADWLAHMFKSDITKLRCETPFRASESEAAFIRNTEHGAIFIYDSGTETAHYAPRFPCSDEVLGMASEIEEFDALSAMVDARHDKSLREAQAAFSIITDEEIEAYRVDTLDDVKAAAGALKAGDVEGAKAALERLAQLHGRTAIDDDFVLALIKKALGKPATMASLRLLLKDVDARRRQRNVDDDGFVPDGGDGGGGDDDGDGDGDGDGEDEDEEDNDALDWVMLMNRRYAIIRDRPDAVFDTRGTERGLLKPLKVAAFHLLHANKTIQITVDGKIKHVARSKLWLNDPQRREYTTVDDYPIGTEPRGALNLWKGLAITPRPGKWPAIEEFLRDVICGGALPDYAYLIDLLNWKIQNPTLNPEVAISLQGLQGYGKGTFGLFLQIIFGLKRYRLFGRPDDLATRFNASAEGKLVMFFDEAVYAHDPKIRGKLKSESPSPGSPSSRRASTPTK